MAAIFLSFGVAALFVDVVIAATSSSTIPDPVTSTLRGTPWTTIHPSATSITPIATATTRPTPQCYLHVHANPGDTCASIAAVFNIDVGYFLRMNPSVKNCDHLSGVYCVADGQAVTKTPPTATPLTQKSTIASSSDEPTFSFSFTFTRPTPSPSPPTSTKTLPTTFITVVPTKSTTAIMTATASVTAPSMPHQTPISPSCQKYHLVSKGDTCLSVEAAYGILDTSFRAWNGFINSGCTNLWLGYYCCVSSR